MRSIKIKVAEPRIEAASKPHAASPFLLKPFDASNTHHETAIYAGKRFHVRQGVSLFLVWILSSF